VFTPTLTGLGERSHLLNSEITLDTHITDVANVLRFEDLTDVVLVGHSYGGWVISGVAEQELERLASIVFVDAPLPQDGWRLLDHGLPGAARGVEALKTAGGLSAPSPPASIFGVNEADIPWVEAKMTPNPIGVLFQPIRLTGARDRVPSKTYVRATRSHSPLSAANQATSEALLGDPSWSVIGLPCGHDVMVDMPDELAQILVEARTGRKEIEDAHPVIDRRHQSAQRARSIGAVRPSGSGDE
jgi:pimeloyl-ACP methyl ester carboxylesterase